MTIAFLFPGQGTAVQQSTWEWRRRSAIVRALTDVAADALKITIDRLLAGRGVMPTEWLQPVLAADCLGIARELARAGIHPGVVTGHSLGEVEAAAFAGDMSDETAVTLAVVRGRLMAREAARHPGGMLVLERADNTAVEDAIAVGAAHGIAQLAAHNTARQWVVAGEWAALRAIAAATPTMTIPVTGPWHSRAMEDAVEEYREALRAAISNPLVIPLVCNRHGRLVEKTDDLVDLLAEQLTHPVQWVRTMDALASFGASDFVTIGPGKTLRSLTHRSVGRSRLHPAECPDDLPRVIRALTS